MNSGKVKSVFIFIILTGILFYFGDLVARESAFSIEDTEQSARFLDIVAVLNDIQFDLDFVNSLGDTAIKTNVYIQPLSSSDAGRDNPFRKSSPSALFESPQDVFPSQEEVRAIFEGEVPPPIPPDLRSLLEGQDIVVPSEGGQDVGPPEELVNQLQDVGPPEELVNQLQDVAPPDGQEELSDPSSATLTR